MLRFQRCCESGWDGQLRPGSIKSIMCYRELIRRHGASHLLLSYLAWPPGILMMRGLMRGYSECDDGGFSLQCTIRRILRSWGAVGSLETRDQRQSTRRCEMAISMTAEW